MADFFEEVQPQDQVQENKEELEKIKLGDNEYLPDELQHLAELGKIAQEAETKYNTKIDRVYPEYTKATQERNKLKEELEQLKNQTPTQPINSAINEDQRQQAIQAAKELGIVTADQLESWYQQRKEADNLLNDCKAKETEIDGSDGRPPFKTQEILEHMRDYGFRTPMTAYKDLYEEQIDKWKEERLSKKQVKYNTETGSNLNKQPLPVKIDQNNIEAAITEALYGSQE